ncbi:XTP/dITP diphosphohydrolase [Neisseria sp. HSC-16F19]|nr:non-canonical purine NTP pyrophosphatase [Neisseria sp. HSC-16F19]MCP2041358.1 XTP/dITP diphosphohydrolase [Neisseria sp. HSC-16F19]
MNTLVLASNNRGKLAEFQKLLAPLNIEVRAQADFAVPDCPEPYHTFVENALAKARHASRISGLPALADDSGICAPALGGAPGVLSARYGGEPKSDAANNAKLSAALAAMDDTAVYYVCVLVLVRHADDPTPLIAEGRWHGQWQAEASGSHGFGYDPHFYIPAFGQTAAELAPEVKNQYSHRAQAVAKLLAMLEAA